MLVILCVCVCARVCVFDSTVSLSHHLLILPLITSSILMYCNNVEVLRFGLTVSLCSRSLSPHFSLFSEFLPNNQSIDGENKQQMNL